MHLCLSIIGIDNGLFFPYFDHDWYYTSQILDKEAVEEVRAKREIPDIKPGYTVQLKVVYQVLLGGCC